MRLKTIIAAVLLLASFMGASAQDRCRPVVVVRQTLYDSFQRAKGNAQDLENNLTRSRQALESFRESYRDCDHVSDIAAMLKQREDAVTAAESQLVPAKEAEKLVSQEVWQIIHDAHDIPVVYRYYDPNYGSLGRIWTMTFTPQGEKIVVIPTYYDLPDHAVGHN